MSSSSETESDSRHGHNGDIALDEEAQDPDDAENYDSDLDLTKDVQPISSFVSDREELFKQVIETLEPEGRLDALIPEILSVLPRIELEQLCLEHLQMMSAKKLRKIMEGMDINEISSDEEDEALKTVQEAPKWKPLQDESVNVKVENEESGNVATVEENGVSRSTSRSSSRSRSSSYSTSSDGSRRRHRRHYRSRRSSHHRRRHHGKRRRRHSRHRRKSSRESEVEREEIASVEATSTKSGTASVVSSATPAVPVVFDPSSNLIIPVLPPTAVSSVPTATFPTSVAPFVSVAPGFVDSAFVAAGAGIALPTLPSMAGIPLISSTGFPPTKKSQYDVSVEDEFDSGAFSPTVTNQDRFTSSLKPAKTTKSEPPRAVISSRLNVPLVESALKKSEPVTERQNGRESTPPPPGTDDVHFENNNGNGNLDEPAPPGTEVLFS